MIIVFCFMSLILSCHSTTNPTISTPICPESYCPGLAPFRYPFYNVTDTRCGLFKVTCTSTAAEIQLGGEPYEIARNFDFDQSYSSLLLWSGTYEQLVNNNSCEALMTNVTYPSPNPALYTSSISPNITLFKCTENVTYFEQHSYNSYTGCKDHNFYYNYLNGTVPSNLPHTCQVVHLPMKVPGPGVNETNIFSLLTSSSFLYLNLSHSCSDCLKNRRLCNTENGQDVQCLDVKWGPGKEATNQEKQGRGRAIKISVIAGSVFLLILSFVIFIIWLLGEEKMKTGWRKKAKYNVKVEMFLKDHEFLAPKRFSYAEVEKMTNSFKFKLGQGGFGTVFKGVLKNQNLVAVKVLNKLKGDGEDFINEVASVGRTSHVNIGHKKALIYEFMPNGSLERFIYNHGSSSSSQLGWEKLHQIAVGIAREMVGGRNNSEIGVDHTSEIYFPHWIYKKVELHEEQLGLHGIVCDEENMIARKMIIVGLWCIQTNPLSRPTITRVLEMLEGDLASLEIPPKPYLSSPPRCVPRLRIHCFAILITLTDEKCASS
ncbi:LOW QUALITY PROTEIN: hypothetical protein M8C21_029987, partial [Ambrosia artemisiifolia]